MKVIQVKNFCIFQNYKNKSSIKLSAYNKNIFIFQRFFLVDKTDRQLEDLYLTHISQKIKDAKIVNQFFFLEIKTERSIMLS